MTQVQVVTVLTPRDPIPEAPHWREYLPMLRLQRDSARWFGHQHMVVTDQPAMLVDGFDFLAVGLSQSLMHAMIEGVIARLALGREQHLVFLDVDCLVAKDLSLAFEDDAFDLGLTRRNNPVSPINNGAMYVRAEAIPKALEFYKKALALCKNHWGGDQEAISQAAAPVPDEYCVAGREGMRIGFLNMKRYGAVPKAHRSEHGSGTFVVHFKGDTKKWMKDYAEAFIFKGDEVGAG